jgi:hypothetical protein
MQYQKCSLPLYTSFLIGNQNRYSGVELSKVFSTKDIGHDAVTRWLARTAYQPADLWKHVKPLGGANSSGTWGTAKDHLLD